MTDTTTSPPPERHPLSQRFHDELAALARLHDEKSQDYGSTADPFANVRAAVEWGVPDWVGAMIRATDKVRRLQALAERGTLANEPARDAFLDLAVYSVIALILYETGAHRFEGPPSEPRPPGHHLVIPAGGAPPRDFVGDYMRRLYLEERRHELAREEQVRRRYRDARRDDQA